MEILNNGENSVVIKESCVNKCKIVLIGTNGVGKSCLAQRYVNNAFNLYTQATIGAAFLTKMFSLNNCTVRLEIWDTAGLERFNSIVPMYYRGAEAAIVVYDITEDSTFIKAQCWVRELRDKGDPNLVIILAGNKKDLEAHRKVQTQTAKAYAEKENLVFFEVSAKSSQNVEGIFHEIGKRCVENLKPDENSKVISLNDQTLPKRKKCC